MKTRLLFTLLSFLLLSVNISQAQPQKITNLLGYVDYEFEFQDKYYFYYLQTDSLWQSDGTTTGTTVLKDLNKGYFIRNSIYKTGNAFFFSTYQPGEVTLWKSNGTGSGTVPIATYNNIEPIGTLNNQFYYLALKNGTSKLYKAGSTGSPTEIKTINYDYSPINSFYPEKYGLTHETMGGNLYFSIFPSGSSFRWDLWKTNGTTSGTIKTISSSTHSFTNLTAFNGALYFQKISGPNENAELWRTTGTSNSTTFIKKFESQSNLQFIKYKNKFYILSAPVYNYYNYDRSAYLYESDGTTGGTKVITKFPVAQITTFTGIVNGQMAFLNGFNDSEIQAFSVRIFRSDGTNKGTVQVKSFNTSTPYSFQFSRSAVVAGNHLFFESRFDSIYGGSTVRLIQSDLTPEGTQTVKDLYPSFPGQAQYVGLTNVNNVLYFNSYSNNWNQVELWKYDPNSPAANIPYFTLVNSDTDEDRNWLQEGDTIVKYPGDKINIRYNPTGTSGSVKFIVNGSTARIENVVPYALAGDNNGDYNAWLPSSQGYYTLTAQRYSGSNATGSLLGSTTIHFYVRTVTFGNPPVANAGPDKYVPLPGNSATLNGSASDSDGSITSVKWSIIYGPGYFFAPVSFSNPNSLTTTVSGLNFAGEYGFRLEVTDNSGLTSFDDVKVTITGQEISSMYLFNADFRYFQLYDGMTLDISGLTNEFNLVVYTNPEEVGSVRISFDEITRVENEIPYTAFGDTPPQYNWHTLSTGTHTVTATPFSGRNASGTAGLSESITFTLVNGASRISADSYSSEFSTASVQCYPNPSSGRFTIKVPVKKRGFGSVKIYDIHGTPLKNLFEGQTQTGSDLYLQWNTDQPGIYFLKTKIGNEESNQKLIVY